MDQSDVFLMQNWDHLLHLLKHLHLQPKTTHETNFARIRPWALDNLTKFYCQTLVFSSLICPEHLALFSRYARNYAGFVKIINPIPTSCISQITVQLPQVGFSHSHFIFYIFNLPPLHQNDSNKSLLFPGIPAI